MRFHLATASLTGLLLSAIAAPIGRAQPPSGGTETTGRPSLRHLVGARAQGVVERAGTRHTQMGISLQGQAPVSRTMLGTLAVGGETHHSPDPIDATLIVRRIDLGTRMRWTDQWSGIGGVSMLTSAQQGASSGPATVLSARLFVARRLSDTLTLMLGGLWSERIDGANRWLGVPGLTWTPHPKVSVRTHQGLTLDYRLTDGKTVSLTGEYRRHTYLLRDYNGVDEPVLTLSRVPISLQYRLQSQTKHWIELGAGVDLRPRETLSDADGKRLLEDTPSPTWILRFAGVVAF